jgi:predicted Zn-dependent peptidase
MINRQLAPEIMAIESIKTGFPCKNGNAYHIVSNEAVFKLDLIFESGGFGQYSNKFHALFASDLVLSGTSKKNANVISEELDLLGAYVFKSCDYYSHTISIYGQTEYLQLIVDLVVEAILDCEYNEDELSIYKSKRISELNINLAKTSFLANRDINVLVMGENHPLASPTDEAIINGICREDLLAYKNSTLINPTYVFTGPDTINISDYFNNIRFKTNLTDEIFVEHSINTSAEKGTVVKKENSNQNAIRLGKIMPSRIHEDYFKISLTNLILGGYFGSRLMKNIREEKGLTYGIHSSITPFRTYSLFKISSECNAQLTNEVKNEIEIEIKNLQTVLVSNEELQTAKNYLIGSLLRNFDGPFNIADRFKSNLDLKGREGFYEDYFKAIHQTSSEDILACANNYFDFNSLKYCISGEY